MVNEIKTVGLLRGARGERPADVDSIASNIVNLSWLVSDFPEIQELDINPLMVMEKGAGGPGCEDYLQGSRKRNAKRRPQTELPVYSHSIPNRASCLHLASPLAYDAY